MAAQISQVHTPISERAEEEGGRESAQGKLLQKRNMQAARKSNMLSVSIICDKAKVCTGFRNRVGGKPYTWKKEGSGTRYWDGGVLGELWTEMVGGRRALYLRKVGGLELCTALCT